MTRRAECYDPKILLKIVLLAYARGDMIAEDRAGLCENVVFNGVNLWQHPDHSTIAAFVATLKEEIQPLFRDVLLVWR